MSDPQMGPASLDERVEDIRAVMDAAGVGRAALFGYSEGGTMSAVFAARYPERVDKLILFASHAGKVRGSDDFPCGYEAEPMLDWMQSLIENRWGEGASLEHLAPSVWKSRSSSRARAGMARFERMAATPGAAMAHFAFNMTNDSRPQMASVTAPTLVLHRAGDRFVPLCNSDHLAAMIPNARLVVMEGEDHLPFVGDVGRLVGEVEMFLTGSSQQFDSYKGGALSPHDPLGGLTDAELRVASLVADGLSNAAIAGALHISRHTVESHLKHSFSKLGIDSRVQLAALVMSSDGFRG